MEDNTKEIGWKIKCMEMDYLVGLREIDTRDSI